DTSDFFYRVGLPTLRVPVHLQVLPFALPAEPTLETIAAVGKCAPEWREALRLNLRTHRVSGEGVVAPVPVTVDPWGGVQVNFAEFNAAWRAYFEEAGLRLFYFPGTAPGDPAAPASAGSWAGLAFSSPLFERAFPAYVQQVAAHLRRVGLLGRAVVRLPDQRVEDATWRQMCRRLAAFFREAAPEARIAAAGMPHADLRDSVDVWVVPFPEGYAAPRLAAARGKAVWAAEDRLYGLDADTSSIEMRAFPWRLKRFGASGAEWWSVSYWGPDPSGRPGSWETQIGGGSLLHLDPTGVTGPVDTIRWEMYREGVEDFEVLTLLERAHARVRQQVGADEPCFATEALVEWVTRPVVPSPFETTRDPARLQGARGVVDALIGFLEAQPPCVLGFAEEGKRLYVVGAVLPGTEVRNGATALRVDERGRFRLRAGGDLRLLVRRRGMEKRLACSLAHLGFRGESETPKRAGDAAGGPSSQLAPPAEEIP
ncbi:MAG: DUF4091 domain-containing protein, partial [Armatimonadota bacterium]|nr:DUF4091 domain-containing protein [Armatimonadota bacterium]